MKIYSTLLKKEVEVTVTEREGKKIVLHSELEKLADEYDVRCTYEPIEFKGLVAVVKCISTANTVDGKERRIEAFGESNEMNLENAISQKYPFIMAAKRAYDRAVIRCLGFFGFYSDCEIDASTANATSDEGSMQLPSQKKKGAKKRKYEETRPLSVDDIPEDILDEINGFTETVLEGDTSTNTEPIIPETKDIETGETGITEETIVEELCTPEDVGSDEVAEETPCVSETSEEEFAEAVYELDESNIIEDFTVSEFEDYPDFDMEQDVPEENVESSSNAEETEAETEIDAVSDSQKDAEFVANPTRAEEKVYEDDSVADDPFDDTSFLDVVLVCGKFKNRNMTTLEAYKDANMRASLNWVATNSRISGTKYEAQQRAAIDTIAYLEKHPEVLSA